MEHHIPYIHLGFHLGSVSRCLKWLQIEEIMTGLKNLPPDQEFGFLLEFLIEFSGGLELTKNRVYETCLEQSVITYEAYAQAVKQIKSRIEELYNEKAKYTVYGNPWGNDPI